MKTAHFFFSSVACLFALSAVAQDNQLLNLSGIPRSERNMLPVEKTWPANPGDAALCLWKDDKTAAITYAVDDNCAHNIDWWLKECGERGIRMTWFLVAGGISKSNPRMNGTWDDWRRVAQAGHALESHTMTHLAGSRNADTWQGIEWEYAESLRHLNTHLGDLQRATTIAYPGGKYPATNAPAIAARHAVAARGTVGMLNGPQGIDYNKVNAMSSHNINTKPHEPFNNVQNIVDFNPSYKRGYRGWAVLFWHDIKERDETHVARTRRALDFYVTHKDALWQGAFDDVAKYAQERETAQLAVVESTDTRIVIRLTDRMRDDLYDVPLTVKVRLPGAWQSLAATQNTKPIPATVIEHDGAKFVLVDIVPDRGDAVLSKP